MPEHHALRDDGTPSRSGCSRTWDACCACVCGSCMTSTCASVTTHLQGFAPHTTKGAKQCGCCALTMFLLGIALIIQAIVVPLTLHKALVDGLQKAVILDDPTNEQFIKWANNTDAPLRLEAYVYDILNPDEIVAGGVPRVVEMGPFVYNQYNVNYNLTFGEESKETLWFRTYSWYEFVPEESVSDASSTILTTVNVPFVSVRAAMEAVNLAVAIPYYFATTGWYINTTEATRLFTRRSVSEVLFGWEDPVLVALSSSYNGLLKNYDSFEESLQDPANDRFWNQIYTGVGKDFDRLRNYVVWHNKSYIATCKDLPTDYCPLDQQIPGWDNQTDTRPEVLAMQPNIPHFVSDLRGNDGSVFPAPVTDRSILTTFYSPFLRTIDLEFIGTGSYKDVPLLDFGLPSHFYSNADTFPPNAAFYQLGPSGLLNMTYMQGHMPLFVSQPRFAGANTNQTLLDALNVTWLEPPSSVPPMLYQVEPQSGVTFYLRTVSQVNLYLNPLHGLPPQSDGSTSWFTNMTSVYMPVMWAKEEGGIGDKDAKTISDVLDIISLSKNTGLIIGVVSTVLGVIYLFVAWRTYDLEQQKHFHAVRSLIATSEEDAVMAGLGFGGEGASGLGSGSLLDPSALKMRVGSPNHMRAKRRDYASAALSPPLSSSPSFVDYGGTSTDDVDITYTQPRPAVNPNDGGASSEQQSDGQDHYKLQADLEVAANADSIVSEDEGNMSGSILAGNAQSKPRASDDDDHHYQQAP
jgi:hypothetical protein